MIKNGNRRLTFGLLSNSFDYEFQKFIWRGFEIAAKEADVNTLWFAGGEINSPELIKNAKNSVYKIISKENIDGLIILPSTIDRYINNEELYNFSESYKDIPRVSIGVEIKNISSIIIDNKNGMKSLVDHLIEKHHYTKFLYLSGPEFNIESSERLSGFIESLESHNIPIDHDRIVKADFNIEMSQKIISELLRKKMDFEVIVSANDYMAIGAINAIREMKIIIPEQIAITGFDDINSAKSLISPLTTIAQPLFEMSYKAVMMLLKKIKNEPTPDVENVKTRLIIRRSCGCIPNEISHVPITNLSATHSETTMDFLAIKKNMMEEFKKSEYSKKSDLIVNLFESTAEQFVKVITGDLSSEKFLDLFNKYLTQSLTSYFDDKLWDYILSVLRKNMLLCISDQPALIIKIENLLHQSQLLIKEMLKQMDMNANLSIIEKANSAQLIMSDIVNSLDSDKLLQNMAIDLPKIGFHSCYLSLHASKEELFGNARLLLAYNKKGIIRLEKNGFIFPAKQLFPREIINIEERFGLIVESLAYEKEQMGFVVFEIDPQEGIIISSMSDQIRSTIKVLILIEDAIEKEKKIETALNELKKNHEILEDTYERLKTNQENLILSEKMASLGRLTSGIAHEMNSPLAAVRASLSELNMLIEEYKKSLNDPDVNKDDHYEIANDMKKSTELAQKAVERALTFIRGIKSQTREMSKEQSIRFNIVDIINESILLLNHVLKSNNISLEFTFQKNNISIYGLPGRLSQVITNLVTNAADAMSDKKKGVIKIDLTEDDMFVILKVEDTGSGIPEEVLNKIYDPLFTTKPFGQGTGLGLTIVHGIVTGEFNGSIKVDSRIDVGTLFTIALKKNKSDN